MKKNSKPNKILMIVIELFSQVFLKPILDIVIKILEETIAWVVETGKLKKVAISTNTVELWKSLS